MILENFYAEIANNLADAAGRSWDKVCLETKVLGNSCSGMTTTVHGDDQSRSVPLGIERVFAVNDSIILLRDDLLRTTGQRIWGLTFTLYPTGKFSIEYDYNKPEGYEESDEVITGDEINASLNELLGGHKKSS